MINSKMPNIAIGLLLMLGLPMVLTKTDYCRKSLCEPDEKHIACKNDGSFQKACGSKAQIIKITDEYRNLILNKHNELRNQVAQGFEQFEPAERMATMIWSQELSKLAELNVLQCRMEHDECRNTDDFQYAGQNLAISSWKGTEKSISSVIDRHIQLWFNEYKDCSMEYINAYDDPEGKVIGHFTAMIQEKSTHVGCGILRHLKANGFTEQIMACNYAYTNVEGYPVYNAGIAASKCDTGVNPNYEFLCSVQEEYDINS